MSGHISPTPRPLRRVGKRTPGEELAARRESERRLDFAVAFVVGFAACGVLVTLAMLILSAVFL
jgi:hypothetical protein